MKHTHPDICLFACCAILLGFSLARAQDWPQWRGPNRDGKVPGFAAPATWPKQLTQKWKVSVGGGVDSSPALVGGKLYVFARQGAEEIILCLDAATGKELWRDAYACPAVTGPSAAIHSGPRSSPAVAGSKVITLGVTGIVSCLDAASGKLIWRKDDFPGAYPIFYTGMSPLIVDGMAIVQIGGPSNGGIVAYDLNGGGQKWKWTDDGPGYGSPALMTVAGTRQIVTLTDKMVVGVALADGKLLWQIPFAVTGRAYNAATPIIDGQTVIITGAGRGTKAVRIDKQGSAFAVTDLWANPQIAVQFNTPVLKDGFLYGLSERGNYFCINAKTGEATWTDTVRRQNFGAILDAGSVLLGLTQDGTLSVFQPNDKAYTEIAGIKVADTQTYAHPVLAGQRLFVRDQDSVMLWLITVP
jgi:outer membrane protein assembly factor BamB